MIYGSESVTQSFDNRVCIEIKVTKRLSCHLYWPEKLKIEWCEVWCVCWYSFTILNFLALLSAFIKLIWTETEDIQFFYQL